MMEDLYETLLFGGDLSPQERSSIEDRLDDDPDLVKAWSHWCLVRRRLRDRLHEHISDRRLLVLYVLDQEGHDDALTAHEREALEAARDELDRAVAAVPALETIVDRIRDERDDFEMVWASHGEDGHQHQTTLRSEAESGQNGTPDRAERAARPPHERDQDRGSRRWARRLAIATVGLVLAVAGILFWPEESAVTTVTVADGDVQVEVLGDGSTVRLVGPATLSYPAEDTETAVRRVTLEEGRAFFDVQRRSDHASFVVETPTAVATVLGTQFGVSMQADTTNVVLATGSVRVAREEETEDGGVVLEPGQHSWVAKEGRVAAPKPVDLTTALDWTGLFVFRSVPIETIAERLNQRYDVQVTVAESLTGEAVTGTFEREQPVEEVLGALAATLGANVHQEGSDQYRLVPAP